MPNNNRSNVIIKNSIYLYIRMLITMGVGIYTSRVILQTLGEVDFGLYNVVSGVVVFITFISSALSSSTSRFLTFSLGKQNTTEVNNIFRSTFSIHVIIGGIIFILLETIGLLLFYQLNIPNNRLTVCFWVYQYAIFSTILSLAVIPFSASIIAHEKMNIYAYTSMIDVILKLLIVFIIPYSSVDHLFLYSTFIFIVNVIGAIINIVYCYKNFPETSIQWLFKKQYIAPIFKYCGWIIIGHFSWLLSTQGLNFLLNIFCGAAVNASRALSLQVQSILSRFVQGFQTALNPQITKSYASGDINYMHTLVFNSSRYSFLILFICSAPIYIATDILLGIWLNKVPEYTTQFVRIILIGNLLDGLINPLVISINSTGKMQSTQLMQAIIYIFSFFSQWLILYILHDPVMAFGSYYIFLFLIFIFRLIILKHKISLSIKQYFKTVCIPLIITVITSISIYTIYDAVTEMPSLINIIFIIIITFITAYFLGLKNKERKFIINYIHKLSKK